LVLSICSSVAKRFSQKLSTLEPWCHFRAMVSHHGSKVLSFWCLLTTYRKLYKLNSAFKRTHYCITTIQDDWDPPSWKSTWRHFFCRGWSDLDKILDTGAEWHVDCSDMSKSKPDVEFQYGGRSGEFNGMSSQSHVSHCRVLPLDEFTVTIPEPHATLHGEVTWQNHCHDPATLQGVRIPSTILKIVFRHILFFLVQFRLWRAAAFVSSPIHLFITPMTSLNTSLRNTVWRRHAPKISLSKSDISSEQLYHSRSRFSKKLMVSVWVSCNRNVQCGMWLWNRDSEFFFIDPQKITVDQNCYTDLLKILTAWMSSTLSGQWIAAIHCSVTLCKSGATVSTTEHSRLHSCWWMGIVFSRS